MPVRIDHNRRVLCSATIDLPESAVTVWGQLRDLQLSACHDPFHKRVLVNGSDLTLHHSYFGIGCRRVGRVLIWRERGEFAFSDLSAGDRLKRFPHVVRYRVESVSERSCRLRIEVTGRWTAPGPRWVGRAWLWWVFVQTTATARHRLIDALARRRISAHSSQCQTP